MNQEDIATKYQYTTAEESIREKDWAAGSKKPITDNELVIDEVDGEFTASIKQVTYPPAWLKIIDEPIVNALDQYVINYETTPRMTTIKVWFGTDGIVKIYNDGQGVEVVKHPQVDIYVPQLVFGVLYQGSNRKKPADSITGGTNGIGAKLSNIFSREFVVETVDSTRSLYYNQKWTNGMSKVGNPIVLPTTDKKLNAEKRKSHTTLMFSPDYVGTFEYPTFTPELYSQLVGVVRTRVVFACIYANYHNSTRGGKHPIAVYFNDKLITIKTYKDLAKLLYPDAKTINTIIRPEVPTKGDGVNYKYDWEVCAVVVKGENFQISNVNGFVARKGTHISHLMKSMTADISAKISKKLNNANTNIKGSVENNMLLFVNSQIPVPQLEGQRKDEIKTSIKKFSGYHIPKKFTDEIGNIIEEQILESMATKTRTKKEELEFNKFTDAENAGKRQAAKCAIIFAEGDSALSQIYTAIGELLKWNYYGAMSLGGVIINARRECTIKETAKGIVITKSDKFTKNIFFKAFLQVTGLKLEYRYDVASPTYKKEMSELRYHEFIGCVDQDLDGKGNIWSLFLSIFEHFWPNLLAAGRVKRFETPIIRAYPKTGGKVMTFYTDRQYRKWSQTNDVAKYNVKYYKGLGTNSREETLSMFKSFRERLKTYVPDETTHDLFSKYLGDDPEERKKILRVPPKHIDDALVEEQERTGIIRCSDHLKYENDPYQRDDIDRKLVSAIDGRNDSGRKILDGVIKAFTKHSELKVSQLAGFISETENYHHGEESLSDSITRYGFLAPGGKQLPIIVPHSNFGSRIQGGKDAASARYIKASFNKRLMNLIYPPEDYFLLAFKFDEGKRGEPVNFNPTIPMAIVESEEVPSHGWKLQIWAQNVFDVISNVRRMILLGEETNLYDMRPCVYDGAPYKWQGTIKSFAGVLYSYGNYTLETVDDTYNGATLYITELPLRVWTLTYIEGVIEKKFKSNDGVIESYRAENSDRNVRIVIKLGPNAHNVLAGCERAWADSIEEYFLLRKKLNNKINMISSENSVIEFKDYKQVIKYWFGFRKSLYEARVIRVETLLELEIKYYRNIIRYIEEVNDNKMAKMKITQMIVLLESKGYSKFNEAKLHSPKFTPNEELESKILRGEKSNYNYLLKLNDLDKSEEGLDGFRKKLSDLEYKLEEYQSDARSPAGKFIGAKLWEKELNTLEKVIKEGLATEWRFGDFGKFQFDE